MSLPRTFVLTVNRPIARYDATVKHLNELGIAFERFNGFDNQLCKLNPVETFDLDRVGERIGAKHVAACLSHYLLWKCMSMQPDDAFLVLEYDVEFPADWLYRYGQAMNALPTDWQVLFLGSCCCKGRETIHIEGEIFEVRYPLCGHAIMYRKSALETLLEQHQKISMPLDIAMFYQSLPLLRTYCVLPALIGQRGTPLPP